MKISSGRFILGEKYAAFPSVYGDRVKFEEFDLYVDGRRILTTGSPGTTTWRWSCWLLFLMQERMHSPVPDTPEGPISITSGDITFILERRLPRRGEGVCDEEDLRRMLESRIQKRLKDQVRRRIKTR